MRLNTKLSFGSARSELRATQVKSRISGYAAAPPRHLPRKRKKHLDTF